YSVHFFFRKDALEKMTTPYRQFANPRSIDALRSSPHSKAVLSNHTLIPAASRALTSGSTYGLSSVACDMKTSNCGLTLALFLDATTSFPSEAATLGCNSTSFLASAFSLSGCGIRFCFQPSLRPPDF